MFFKRASQDKDSAPAPSTNAAAAPHAPLPAYELRRTVEPKSLGFETTAEVEPSSGLIGQDRALRAIQFGANMRSHDFNMFVLGPPASGKSTAVKSYLAKKVLEAAAVFDWVYVNNF